MRSYIITSPPRRYVFAAFFAPFPSSSLMCGPQTTHVTNCVLQYQPFVQHKLSHTSTTPTICHHLSLARIVNHPSSSHHTPSKMPGCRIQQDGNISRILYESLEFNLRFKQLPHPLFSLEVHPFLFTLSHRLSTCD